MKPDQNSHSSARLPSDQFHQPVLRTPFGEIAAGERPFALDAGEHLVNVVAPFGGNSRQPRPGVAAARPFHAPAQQRLDLHRQQRGFMAPVFEEQGPAAPRPPFPEFAPIRTEPREGGQVVIRVRTFTESIWMTLNRSAKARNSRRAGRPDGALPGETLGGQGHAQRLPVREREVHGAALGARSHQASRSAWAAHVGKARGDRDQFGRRSPAWPRRTGRRRGAAPPARTRSRRSETPGRCRPARAPALARASSTAASMAASSGAIQASNSVRRTVLSIRTTPASKTERRLARAPTAPP